MHWSRTEGSRTGERTLSVTDKSWCRSETMGCLWNHIFIQERNNDFTNFFNIMVWRKKKKQKGGIYLESLFFLSLRMWLVLPFSSHTQTFTHTNHPLRALIFEFIHYPYPSASITHPVTAPRPQSHTHTHTYTHAHTHTQTQKLRYTPLPANRLSVWFLQPCLRHWHLHARSIDFVVLS